MADKNRHAELVRWPESETARRSAVVPDQQRGRPEADDPDRDERALDEACRDVAEGEPSLYRRKTAYGTTAVPTLATMRTSSSSAPSATFVVGSGPAPVMVVGSSSTGAQKMKYAGIEVTKVTTINQPVSVAVRLVPMRRD